MQSASTTPIVSRRRFLATGAVLAAGAVAVQYGVSGSAVAAPDLTPLKSASGKVKFQLGIASYTYRSFDRAKTIAFTKQLGLSHLCFKDMHLSLKATEAECAAAAKECEEAGIKLSGCGVVGFGKPEDIDNAFRYARAAGMETIVCSISKPELADDLLKYLDAKLKEPERADIYAAFHNHGPGDRVFPTTKEVYEKVKDLHPHIGFCADIGHTVRIGGDAVADLTRCPERLFDVHMKDVTSADKAGVSCVAGTGVIDLPKVIKALVEIGYSRRLSFEYEENAKDPQPYVAQTVGYVQGIARVM